MWMGWNWLRRVPTGVFFKHSGGSAGCIKGRRYRKCWRRALLDGFNWLCIVLIAHYDYVHRLNLDYHVVRVILTYVLYFKYNF